MRLLLPHLLFTLVAGCSCEPPPDPPPADTPVGSVRVDVDNGAATLVLVGLDQPLRAFQADIAVNGGNADAFTALGDHDVAEAGLSAPRPNSGDRFTVVVGDTRRLPLNNGPLARLSLDDNATVTLTRAFGVDQAGKKRSLAVVVR